MTRVLQSTPRVKSCDFFEVVESVRGSFVYAANGGAFLRTPVVLGSRQGDRIEVMDGLFEGDEIVTAGASNLWMIELQAVNGGKGCADGH
jgi:cobalt-zinc-cadmium efflux system membrane fusion protein